MVMVTRGRSYIKESKHMFAANFYYLLLIDLMSIKIHEDLPDASLYLMDLAGVYLVR